MLKKHILTLSALMCCFSISQAENLIAGYIDITASGSAVKVDMAQAHEDGYNMVVFGFASIKDAEINFYGDSQALTQQKIKEAKAQGMKVLVSVGGMNNTFQPGSADLSTLATNIVKFINDNQLDGIDFDIEVQTDPEIILNLLTSIRHLSPSILITAAPQINDGVLVTTEKNTDYNKAIEAGLFDYLFLQEYNTGSVQNQISYISSIYNTIKQQVPSNTKIVTGEPTAAVGAGPHSIYYPSSTNTTPYSTTEVTVLMLPELKKIMNDDQFGGVMGWSLNLDYDPYDYNDTSHVPGSYAYGLKDCVMNSQCDNPPPPKPAQATYTLQVSNTDSATGIGFILTIKDSNGDIFTSDYIAPTLNKVYAPNSNPSTSTIEGKQNLTVHWTTYTGGPSGDCSGSFDLTSDMNIMVSPTNQSCAFGKLP